MDVLTVPDESHAVLQFQLGAVLPGPQGQRGLLPVGAIKIPIGYKMTKEFIEELEEAIDGMKPPSDLIISSDMGEAREAAEVAEAIRTGA